jgi:hypothetical protein
MHLRRMFVFSAVALLFHGVPEATAQSVGTFRWQLQPYCNVLTLAVTQVGSAYRVEGRDDVCGAGKSASAIGTAYPNPDGSIGFGITVVPAEGPAVQLTASITLAGFNGTWRDSEGNAGTFIFTPGSSAGGAARPLFKPTLPGVNLGGGLVMTPNVGPGGEPTRVLSVNEEFIRAAARVRFVNDNVGLGASALAAVSNASVNTAVGTGALQSTINGEANAAFGWRAMAGNTSGSNNVAAGMLALWGNISGNGNVAIGSQAMYQSTAANSNVAIGYGALNSVSTGAGNVAIGYQAGEDVLGSGSILIGFQAGNDTAPTGANNIYIGSRGFLQDQNTIRIGNLSHQGAVINGIAGQTTVGGVPVLINGGGRLGTVNSSRRFKTEIEPMRSGELMALQALRPVRFVYKPEYAGGGRELQYGLIAEEVADTMPDLVVRDEAGAPQTVRYQLLAPLLLADAQRLERERTALAARVQSLESERDALQAALAALAGRLAALETTAPRR